MPVIPFVFEENMRVWFVAVIANIAAPTVAEIGAGTEVTAQLTKDGVSRSPTNNKVDVSGLNTAYDATVMGSHSNDLSLKFRLWTGGADVAFVALGTRGITGHIMVSRIGGAVATTKVEVYPIQTGQPEFQNSAANENQMWICPVAVTSAPNTNATVTA